MYPDRSAERDRWIVERRGPRNAVDPNRPYAFLVEDECSHTGELVPVATVFLTNRECPWRCLMCDLWKNTLPDSVPVGAIPRQVEFALTRLEPARQLKLYNSGSFFDPRAIPPEDYPAIAALAHPFERVIVESHPALIGDRCLRFRDLVGVQLEVAMGLETVHPVALERLNKGLTADQFARAVERLRANAIDLRVFILVQPAFVREDEALFWAERSIDFAFACGASAITLIPTRGGNGAMDEMAVMGHFDPPRLRIIEAALEYGLRLRKGRVFADLWDIDRVRSCAACQAERVQRLGGMNLSQIVAPRIACSQCSGHE